MKKRNFLVALLLVFTMLLSACGASDPFVGKWKGTCDLTDYIVQGVVSGDETMEKYLEFEGLEFVINFEFTEDEISMSVDEASLDSFVANFEAGMINMMEAMLIDELAGYGMSYEEYVAESGMDSEALMKELLDEMNMTAQMDAMVEALAESLELSGTYSFDGEVLTVTYEDNTYEEMGYVFDGETLTITVSDGETEFPIICEKQN